MRGSGVLRSGPESTALVLREGGGTRRRALVRCLRAFWTALGAPLVLAVPTLLVAFFMLLAGAAAATIGRVAGGIAGVEYLLAVPLLARLEFTTVHRLEFAPAAAPDRFRLVRAGGADAWQPLAGLCGIRLEHQITEPHPADPHPDAPHPDAPRPADPHPAAERLLVRLDLAGDELKWTPPAGTDPEGLHRALTALLGPGGVRVELFTERTVRSRRMRGPGPTSGGSASANSGGFSGGG